MGLFGRKTEREDNGTDNIGQNPTGRPRRSSAGTRRRKDRQTFGGTAWDREKKDGKK